ncbi:hypothetical protein HanLR1_Chr03g0118621 [Helianthus annuus]|nr:hypothetical protein HanLR1_Chr03g0118621 [Helianthus annuus]
MHQDGYRKLVVAHILAATTVGFTWAAAVYRRRKNSKSVKPESIVPRLDLTGSGHVGRVENFPHYVGKLIFPS